MFKIRNKLVIRNKNKSVVRNKQTMSIKRTFRAVGLFKFYKLYSQCNDIFSNVFIYKILEQMSSQKPKFWAATIPN